MVGDEPSILTPPPSRTWPEASPPWSVKPRRIDARPSPDVNVTTGPARLPSMIVAWAPCSLSTVIAFPWKLMFSTYVPGATRTLSPAAATSIAPWIVGVSKGTRITICADADPGESRTTTDENNAIVRSRGSFLPNRLGCISCLPLDFSIWDSDEGSRSYVSPLDETIGRPAQIRSAGGGGRRDEDARTTRPRTPGHVYDVISRRVKLDSAMPAPMNYDRLSSR